MNQWYLHQNLKVKGPFTDQKICELVRSGDIGPNDLISQNEESWRPAQEFGEIPRSLFPAFQVLQSYEPQKADWFYLSAHAQIPNQFTICGPVSMQWLQQKIELRELLPSLKIWKQGLTGWFSYSDRLDFF